ncbi:HSP20-like chaperone [Podospora aff. communis PSN243]|uniref:HSP20-like chaperone n=1 Tax=Podospora aff. communis PSN243 TaxID=3040156 RepID=A0AAV9GEK1_9PEZI|nr:HSP20-like chaperone [Podospora aff. communis PSN243]
MAPTKTHDLLPPALATSPTFAPLLRFLEEIDKLPHHHGNNRSQHSFAPRFDLVEFPAQFELYGDLPGVKKEDVTVELKEGEGILVVKGKRTGEVVVGKGEGGDEGGTYVVGERGMGSFERRFRLAGKVRREGVMAGLDEGVLRVIVPKVEREEERGERIEIL